MRDGARGIVTLLNRQNLASSLLIVKNFKNFKNTNENVPTICPRLI